MSFLIVGKTSGHLEQDSVIQDYLMEPHDRSLRSKTAKSLHYLEEAVLREFQ